MTEKKDDLAELIERIEITLSMKEKLEEIVKNAIHEHDKAVDKRNGGNWFIWQ